MVTVDAGNAAAYCHDCVTPPVHLFVKNAELVSGHTHAMNMSITFVGKFPKFRHPVGIEVIRCKNSITWARKEAFGTLYFFSKLQKLVTNRPKLGCSAQVANTIFSNTSYSNVETLHVTSGIRLLNHRNLPRKLQCNCTLTQLPHILREYAGIVPHVVPSSQTNHQPFAWETLPCVDEMVVYVCEQAVPPTALPFIKAKKLLAYLNGNFGMLRFSETVQDLHVMCNYGTMNGIVSREASVRVTVGNFCQSFGAIMTTHRLVALDLLPGNAKMMDQWLENAQPLPEKVFLTLVPLFVCRIDAKALAPFKKARINGKFVAGKISVYWSLPSEMPNDALHIIGVNDVNLENAYAGRLIIEDANNVWGYNEATFQQCTITWQNGQTSCLEAQ